MAVLKHFKKEKSVFLEEHKFPTLTEKLIRSPNESLRDSLQQQTPCKAHLANTKYSDYSTCQKRENLLGNMQP